MSSSTTGVPLGTVAWQVCLRKTLRVLLEEVTMDFEQCCSDLLYRCEC